MTLCERSAQSHSVRTSGFLTSRSAGLERPPHGPRTQVYAVRRRVRAVFLLAVLSSVVLADAACVRKVRTVNDNFYVINRKTGAAKPPAAPDPILAVTTPQLSDSVSEALKIQASSGPRPKSLLSNAEILEEENSTISSLLRKAQTDPANASVHFQLGRAYHDFRLYDEALRHYQNALRLEPENPVYYEQTGRLWRDWRSPHLAVDLVMKALELDPGFVEAWNTLGTIYERQGNSEQAQDAYLHALSLNPDLDYVHSNLCFSYLQSGKVEQAIRHGVRATHLNPTMLVAHNNLGLAYGMLGEFDRSLEEFKHSGDEAAARNNLGLMLLKHGQITESMEQFKLAARMRPYHKDAAANYRRARDLNFQRAREARARLRSFDREGQMETTPGTLGLVAIEHAGLRLLDGTLDLLSSQPLAVHPSKSVVEVDIANIGSHTSDEKEFGELLGAGRFRLRRFLVVPGRRKHTVVFYKQGYVNEALELAHRIPGNQAVLQTHSSDQGAEIRILLGLDFARVAKQPSKTKLCPKTALDRSKREVAVNAR